MANQLPPHDVLESQDDVPHPAASAAVGLVGLVAAVGLVASAASWATGDFEDAGRRWVAIAGVAIGASALIAAGHLLLRLQRSAHEQFELHVEAAFLLKELRARRQRGRKLTRRQRRRATRLYGRLMTAKLVDEANELLHEIRKSEKNSAGGREP